MKALSIYFGLIVLNNPLDHEQLEEHSHKKSLWDDPFKS
jgi:hypothetical protein